MKYRKEIVIGLIIVLIIMEVTTVILPLFQKITDTNMTLLASNSSLEHFVDEGELIEHVKEENNSWILGANHIGGITLCIISNILVIIGIKMKKSSLLLPWLFIYILGKKIIKRFFLEILIIIRDHMFDRWRSDHSHGKI